MAFTLTGNLSKLRSLRDPCWALHFFNIYINDLNLQVTNTSLQLYANDTTEYAMDASPPVLEYIINSDLHILSTWLQQNYLHTNASKTQAMTIGPVPYRCNLSVDDIQQLVKNVT